VDIPSVYEVLDFTSSEKCLSILADISIGMAIVDDPRTPELDETRDEFIEEVVALGLREQFARTYWSSLAAPSDGPSWRDLLVKVARDVSASRRGIVMADLCLDTMTADIEDLATGIGARRLNAVLDLLDVPFCSSDVQSFHFSMTENLASLKSNWVHEAGAFGASMAGGFASGFFVIPSIVTATQKGVGYLMEHVQKADPFDVAVAHLLSCAVAADESRQGEQDFIVISNAIRDLALQASRDFGQHRERSANLYMGDAAQYDRHRRVLNGAVRVLEQLNPSDVTSVLLEDVTGMPLSAARSLLEAEGFRVVVESGDRFVMNEHNWVVTKEIGTGEPGTQVTPGGTVTLRVAKWPSAL